jgi:TolB-like protein/DNA-binding winged helix-turn-helix (wHTH) protein
MDNPTRPTGYEFGDFRVDVPQRLLLLKANGRPLPLNARAFDTLLFFLEHSGELLHKSTLMAAIWPKVVVEENNLNQHISALRRVLGERPEEHRFIVTVPGRGYRFVAAVHPVTDVRSAATPVEGPGSTLLTHAPIAPTAPEDSVPLRAPNHPRSNRLIWGLGAGGLVLAAALAWYLGIHHGAGRGGSAEHTPPITSIDVVPIRKPRLAILPFENLSPDPKNAFFADGLHEEIVSTLAERVPGVEVISRTTMMSYRANPPKPLSTVARELGASHLIEGSVRREGNKIRLTVQLIDARADAHIWSASYDRTLADTLSLESEVAEEIARQLRARLTGSQRPDSLPVGDTEAFDLYLKAVVALRTFNSEPAVFHQIEDLLTRVIARQPSFALAYAQRARARTLMFISSRDTSDEFVTQIRTDLATARRLAPNDPMVLAATGYFLMCANDTSGALEAYAAAEAAGLQGSEWLIPKAHLLLRRSRIDELNATVQRMLSLDPADPLTIAFATYDFASARQPSDALRAVSYARDTYPSVYAGWSGYLSLDFAGRTKVLRSFLERYEPATDAQGLIDSLPDYFLLLRYEHRYHELRAHIDRVPVAASNFLAGVDFGPVGPTPTALFRGWADLLLGDSTAAAQDGRAVLRFVERQSRTPWNAGHLEALAAAGYTFTGQCAHAHVASKNSLGLVSRADDAVVWRSSALRAAYVAAWCGAPKEAISLLRDLTSARPGIGPASVARDPLFTVPLGLDAAFRELREQLEGTIRATSFKADEPATAG